MTQICAGWKGTYFDSIVTPIELHNKTTYVSVLGVFTDGCARSTNAPIQQYEP